MKADFGSIRLSASDLSNHLACNHLTALDYGVATRTRPAPAWHSPDAWVLQQRGLAHESAYVEHLKFLGLSIVNLRDVLNEVDARLETFCAMQQGVDVVVQAVLTGPRWFGRADVLRKVAVPSRLGDWSSEVYDCKLALETKGATILQLSLYSELVAEVQGRWSEFMYVVSPTEGFVPEAYRVLDYAAYYRYVKRHLEDAVEDHSGGLSTYPEPSEHCVVCRWWAECDKVRRADDHLSLVAGISKLQRRQLTEWDVNTVGKLAGLAIPLQQRPERGSKAGYVRVREQARIQVEGRTKDEPVYEVLPLNAEQGFFSLPELSSGDVFFDFEADPFVGRQGREYLFGLATDDGAGVTDQCRWAISAEDEKQAFEWFVDFVMARWQQHPPMHVQHFTRTLRRQLIWVLSAVVLQLVRKRSAPASAGSWSNSS
jgi:predicted RecB family nuclease